MELTGYRDVNEDGKLSARWRYSLENSLICGKYELQNKHVKKWLTRKRSLRYSAKKLDTKFKE